MSLRSVITARINIPLVGPNLRNSCNTSNKVAESRLRDFARDAAEGRDLSWQKSSKTQFHMGHWKLIHYSCLFLGHMQGVLALVFVSHISVFFTVQHFSHPRKLCCQEFKLRFLFLLSLKGSFILCDHVCDHLLSSNTLVHCWRSDIFGWLLGNWSRRDYSLRNL